VIQENFVQQLAIDGNIGPRIRTLFWVGAIITCFGILPFRDSTSRFFVSCTPFNDCANAILDIANAATPRPTPTNKRAAKMIGRECAQKSAQAAPNALASQCHFELGSCPGARRLMTAALTYSWPLLASRIIINTCSRYQAGRIIINTCSRYQAGRIIINTCSWPHPPDVTDLGRSQPHLRPAVATASRCPSLIQSHKLQFQKRNNDNVIELHAIRKREYQQKNV
jgi:hypothetical protein